MGVSSSAFDVSNCTAQNLTTFVLNMTTVAEHEYTPLEAVIIAYILPCVLLFCLVGNLTFFFTVFRVKRMWNTTNLYLVNLSVADICLLSVVVGEKSYRYYVVKVPSYGNLLGTWGCVIIYLGVYTSYFTSLFIVTLISVERYFAICMPLKHIILWSKKRTVTVVVAAWFLAMFLATTVLPGYLKLNISCLVWPGNGDYGHYPNVVGLCGPFGTGSLAYDNFLQTVPFFIAVVANSIFYVQIILKMKDRTKISRETTSSIMTRAKFLQVRNQVCRMLMINGIVFFCCQAPYEVGCFVFFVQTVIYSTEFKHTNDFLLNNEQYRDFIWVARLLVYINAMVNPVVFSISSPTYRRAFKAAFSRHPNKTRSRSSRAGFDDCVQSSKQHVR